MENTNIAFLLMATLVSGLAVADQKPGAQPRKEPATRQEMQMPKDQRLKVGSQTFGSTSLTTEQKMLERVREDRQDDGRQRLKLNP